MPDYNKSSIYKIVCNNTGLIYVGSTCQPLHQRLAAHVKSYKEDKNVSSKQIIQNGNYSIILIEEYQCQNKQQLLRKEREYIDALECVNKRRPITSIEEKKEEMKEYNNTNKDKIKEYLKEYYNNNKDKIKEYYNTNKDKIKVYRIAYNKLNKDKRNKKIEEKQKEKITCSICITEMRKDSLIRHKKIKHKPDFTLIE